jgi:hypothetical protein
VFDQSQLEQGEINPMTTPQRQFAFSLSLLVGTLLLQALPACAETPLDGMFTTFLESMPLWGQLLVGIGGLGLAILAIYGLSQGPAVLMYIVVGFAVLALIVAATTGSLFEWLQRVMV